MSMAVAGCGGGARGEEPKATPSCPTTVPKPTVKIAPSTIYLNIVNAGNQNGAAGRASKQLGWRGFHVLETKSQSLMDDRPVPKAAEIRYGKGGLQIALTLATQVKNPVLTEDDRSNPTVDLVIGDAFGLVPLPPTPAKDVQINVYNTTYRAGLSGQVAAAMRARGFQILSNDNDPRRRFLPNDVAYIISGERGEPAARRVALQLKGAKLQQDGRQDNTVDVVIGNHYTALVPTAQATPAPTPTVPRPPGC
ncbi:LytR C-terminal domain-containing protein [Luteipulveratus sp. YIM 133132]|uniref:LytR C-terminal domain-containing protein n=1 Tax=Luteipulveratus flavus TaxID=3031728 RepID=A0ABT6CBP3_9MICO|nr:MULTISPECIES: LytR C-terminal domain-containing protein [unclassified Luteipulveratus]MDE9365653.1 LytR C-terminal domain-containing protein [Luteipulveratus sp. YIM 133132]MDF8266309.1 LytR C-terminal domain-containing protein [Luteipulveratus sp. YIM 133296]